MIKTKKLVTLWLVGIAVMLWCARWAKVTFQPLYSDARFQPAGKLAAGCASSADISLSPQGQKITKFTLVIYYNPENIEILRVLPRINNGVMNSKIEYDKIVLEVGSPDFSSMTAATSFFQIYFKSDIVGKQILTLWTGSEAVTANKTYPLQWIFNLDFAKVPECEPDVVPPSVSLIYPKDTNNRITLDQYFIFDIKDIGKWIDKNSVIINFDGQQYFYGSENMKWNGNYLTFYPGTWIPIDAKVDLKISIADKQVYGWANKTESMYSFKSATWMVLNKNISPMMFIRIAQEAERISASPNECALLTDFYNKSEVSYQQELKSIIQKVWCNLTNTGVLNLVKEESALSIKQKQYRSVSVLAMVGRALFIISFMLKIHYLLSYRRHKKIVKDLMK